ncbi:hypothetical protein SDC9_179644 [bioreactor metagenome]|uniref:TonB C-terminal domain-containing protein n=1 Tax=bioreactor metagenome TaxID=1076179 RepID=A0A645GZK1_9ZZZZ
MREKLRVLLLHDENHVGPANMTFIDAYPGFGRGAGGLYSVVGKPAIHVLRRQAPQPILAAAVPAAPSSFVVAPQPPAPPAPQPVAPPAPAPVAIVAARFDADYLHNPKPVYPALSRRLSEEGKVLLKVRVSAQGAALEVVVSKSSGFPRLDAAAVAAVERWRFVPARRGDEPVDSSVVVPIAFALD